MLIRCNSCFQEYDESFGLCPNCGYADGEPPEEAFCLTPGTVIAGRYIIGGMLGLGGFGITYRAWDKKLDTILAIKEYYPSGLVNRQPGGTNIMLVAAKREREFIYGKTRFLEEARNMAKFSTHKNIVNVFDFFEANNTAYIVMEFLDGKTLSQTIQQQNVPLPYDYCVGVATQVCAALKAIHKENILHRDVSPDNIMICNDGTVKLFDFGAARFSAGVENRVTVVVKPGFAPPEQYDKVNRQGPRTDIYALGATLYYAMTGIKPEESTNRKIDDNLLAPSAIDNSIPQNISNAIMRAMAVEQQYRFASADDFSTALSSGKKVVSVQKERARRWRRRAMGMCVSLAVVIGVLASVAFILKTQRDGTTLPDAELCLWYIQTGNGEFDNHKEEALKRIVEHFTSEYSNVRIELVPVGYENYQDALAVAAQNGQVPAIFESTNVAVSGLAAVLPEDMDLDRMAGFVVPTTDHDRLKFQTGFIAPIIYVNSTIGSLESTDSFEGILKYCQEHNLSLAVDKSAQSMYSLEYIGEDIDQYVSDTATEDFLGRTLTVLLGSSSDYFEVQKCLPGEYTIMSLDYSDGDMTYEYGTQWSISTVDGNEMEAATAFLRYLTTPLAQDYLYIQGQTGELPIVQETMGKYMEIYGELSQLQGYFSADMVTMPPDYPDVGHSKQDFNTTVIPQTIVDVALSNAGELSEEYRPKITFYEDKHCELVLNMAEWMQNISAGYEVFAYPDGSKVIKCNLGDADLGDGLERNLRDFILVQTSEKEWTFYGQPMGLTVTDAIFTSTNSNSVEVQSEVVEVYSPVVGEYLDNDRGGLAITGVDGKKLSFGVSWYRWTGMSGVTAELYGNYAIFNYITEDGYNETKGYLEFADADTIILTLAESKLPYMEPSTYTYKYVSAEELKAQAIEYLRSTLLWNDNISGWFRETYSGTGNRYEDLFIQFADDETLRYWVGVDGAGEITYTEYNGYYSVGENTLIINDCAYEAIIDEGASPHLYLTAKGEDSLHLEGSYILGENETYQFLVAN